MKEEYRSMSLSERLVCLEKNHFLPRSVVDERGRCSVNKGYRKIQFNSALSDSQVVFAHPSVNQGILKIRI